MKLSLGTVQFGMPYGIASKGQPDLDSAYEILNFAFENGISAFDTAGGYGNAESVLGGFIRSSGVHRTQINLTSKPRPDIFRGIDENAYYKALKTEVESSLDKLQVGSLNYYLFHDPRLISSEAACEAMVRIKEDKLVENIGVSVYSPDQAAKTNTDKRMNAIQIPYNIFDKRLEKSWFQNKRTDLTVFARSAFLQGLLLLPEEKIPPCLKYATKDIALLDVICKRFNVTRYEACLQYIMANSQIDYLVFGVDNISQLKEMILKCDKPIDRGLINELRVNFLDMDETIINPSLWKS